MQRGLLLMVVIFATALAAPIAGAAEIHADTYSAELNGQQTTTMAFDVEGLETSCKSASLIGTLSGPAEAVSLHPSYSGCTAFGLSATVTTTGCSFVLHAGSEIEEDHFGGTADVSCESGKKITIVAATCEVQIGGQTGLTGMEFTNYLASSPIGISLVHGITGLKYNKTKDSIGCPLKGTGEGTGKYTGTQLVDAAAGGNPVGTAVAQGPAIEFGPPNPPVMIPISPATKNVTIKNKTRVKLYPVINDTSGLPFKKTGTTCGEILAPLAHCEDTLTTEAEWPASQKGSLVLEFLGKLEYTYGLVSPP